MITHPTAFTLDVVSFTPKRRAVVGASAPTEYTPAEIVLHQVPVN
jgi:hypothetical protein